MGIRVGVICPERGDREKFLEQFHRQIARQTLKPEKVEVVDYVPESFSCDITQRYKRGYYVLRGKDLDVIAFMEVDDWYAPDYLEVMCNKWLELGKPKMLGLNYTIYYHLLVGKSFVFKHERRSSMMSTLMRPDMDVDFGKEDYPYTDSWLWKTVGGIVFNPKKCITVGLKHGIGMCGGQYHRDNLQRYSETNIDFRKLVGDEDFAFYRSLYPPTARLVRDKAKGLHLVGL